jgi:hypothetical protein
MTDAPRAGDVLRYPYLWARQAGQGETEGRKTRPCAVILALKTGNGLTELRLCAVTTQPPQSGTHAVEVPEIERRRAGLDVGLPLWVIVDEHNVDVFEQSFYIEPQSQIGAFSSAFTKDLQAEMIVALRQRNSKAVRRRD